MGLQSALTTALTGLQAAETSIDVVGNNVANSSTVGFKESEAVFATQFLQTISIGGAPNANSGGTNPRQIGLGVKVAAINPNFSQGTIEISSNPLDVAIQGDGFLIVQSGTGRLYTRNGQLQLNANNEVVTATGQRVLGYGVDDEFNLTTDNLEPLVIPLGQERVAQATKNALFTGVLNPAVDEGSQPEIVQSVILGDNSIEPPDDTDFTITDVDSSPVPSPASAVEGAAGVGGPTSGTYSYRVAFLDDNDNVSTYSSAFTVTNSTDATIDISSLPDADNIQWTKRALYRTEADGSDYYQVAVINDADTTTSFADTMDDATLVAQDALETSVIEPGSYSYYVTFYNSAGSGTETRPTSKIGPVSITESTGGRVRLDLSDIPAPADANYNKLRIYRSNEDGIDFRRVAELDAPGSGSFVDSYVDTMSSTEHATQDEINLDGPPPSPSTRLVDILTREGDSYRSPFVPGRLSFAGQKDGVTLSTKYLDITEDTTLGNLMSFVDDALGLSAVSDIDSTNPFPSNPPDSPTAGVTITADGRLEVVSNYGEENAISIPLTAFKVVPEGKTANQTIPLGFNSSQTADGPGTSTEFIVYDSLGLPLSIRVTTVLEEKTGDSTTYRWYATTSQNEPLEGVSTVVGDGVLVFDQNGDLADTTSATINIDRTLTASESPLVIDLDYSSVKSLGEVDALGNNISSLNVTSQDGFPPGVLTDFLISEDGLIQGQFSNGTQRIVGQLMMARFANNGGLAQVGDSLFAVGVNSGEAIYGKPGEDGIGTLTAGAVELSNSDIGQNLIELILASTQYRGGARVISASQDLLDELLALRR